ncbi:hypothetical protein FXO38_27256 [Capsicum annuum]|nr:hypothetical protein FXO38_27256 [Capsicum annuum]
MLEYNFIVIDTLHVALSLMAVPSTGAKVVLPMHCHLLVPSTPVLFVHVSMLWYPLSALSLQPLKVFYLDTGKYSKLQAVTTGPFAQQYSGYV